MKIEIRNTRVIHYIEIGEIVYCKAERMYSDIYLQNCERIIFSQPLKELEQILPTSYFCKIHKSYIANIKYLSKMKRLKNRDFAILNNTIELPVSRNQKTHLMKMIKERLCES